MTHNSLRISARIPKIWRILLLRSTIIEIVRYDGVLLLNEHGDLYILLHHFGDKLSPLNQKHFKKNIGRKKRYR